LRPVLANVAADIEERYPTSTDYEKIVAAQSYLLDGSRFTYTYDLPELRGQEPIAAFFTQTRRGSCEQFSTALALILRVWGIPTRLVVGFKGGEFDVRRRAYEFRDKHAHAWVEVIFADYGWVEFDPTPGANVVGEAPGGVLYAIGGFVSPITQFARRLYRRARVRWGASVIGYSRAKQRRVFEGLSEAAWSLAERGSALFRAVWPGMPDLGLAQIALLVAALTFAGMGVYLAARWIERRLRLHLPDQRADRTLRFYRELLAVLRKKGLTRPPHVTPREFARMAVARLAEANEDAPAVAGALERVTALFYRVRFGGYELTDAQSSEVREALRVLARARRAGSPRRRHRDTRPMA
jgi:transglutaminase-like putative cysteine protease